MALFGLNSLTVVLFNVRLSRLGLLLNSVNALSGSCIAFKGQPRDLLSSSPPNISVKVVCVIEMFVYYSVCGPSPVVKPRPDTQQLRNAVILR